MIPTLFGISLIVFVIINLAPGSPIEQKIQALRFSEAGASGGGDSGVNQEIIESLKKQYGFDKPLLTRYGIWLKNLATFNFGDSFTYEEPVLDVIKRKFPVSLQFGLTSFILVYLICIPLGVFLAMRENSWIDAAISTTLGIFYAIPPFMLGILLIVFLAGGSFFDIFPLGEMMSDNYDDLSFFGKIWDRIHHFILPGICYMIGSFTTLSFLMKNSLLEEIKKNYIRTAQAKGLDKKTVYLKHALRNALIPIVTGIGGFLSIFFAGSILIEQIFQLDGIGLLSYKALLDRDYNIIMGMTFLQSLALLVGNVIGDLAYVLVDPRIDFK